MNREARLAIMDTISILCAGAAITLQVVMLTSCGQPYHDHYDQVIKMRSYPLTGSK